MCKKQGRTGLHQTLTCLENLLEKKRLSVAHFYWSASYKITQMVFRHYSELIDQKGLKHIGSGYSIDHRLSRHDGFNKYKEIVPLKIMNHPCNLKILSREENSIKGKTSSITLTKLKENIRRFNKKYGDPFNIRDLLNYEHK